MSLIVTTTENIPGHRIVAILGIARGNAVRARHVGSDIVAGLRNIVGGEIPEYTKLMGESREQAFDRMMEQARQMGANAVVGMRFGTSMITQGAAEILAFGTAVQVEKE